MYRRAETLSNGLVLSAVRNGARGGVVAVLSFGLVFQVPVPIKIPARWFFPGLWSCAVSCGSVLLTLPRSRWIDGRARSKNENISFLRVWWEAVWKLLWQTLLQLEGCLVFWVRENSSTSGLQYYQVGCWLHERHRQRSAYVCFGWDFFGLFPCCLFLPPSRIIFMVWIALLFKNNIMLSKTYSLDTNLAAQC